MRVLFAVSSWPTHYASMVPLGWALQAAGHEVRVLCAPSQSEPVGRAGLMPVPVLGGKDVALYNRLQYYWEAVHGQWPYPWLPLHPVTAQPLDRLDDFDVRAYRAEVEPELGRRARQGADAAVAFARRWEPDLVLHDPACLEGRLVAKLLEVPSALSLWGPVGTHEAEHMRIVPADTAGLFPAYGLAEFEPDQIEHVIDPCPAALAPPTAARRLPVRFVPYNGCAPIPDWLLEPPERPRICVTWSTALTTMSGSRAALLPELVRALSGADTELVVLGTEADTDAIGANDNSVRVLPRFPLRLILPTCAAVVHHGGGGSTMTALAAGLPQLTITFAAEQAANGDRVAAAGAGLHLPGWRADRSMVREYVAELMSVRSYQDSAAALRAEMDGRPSPAELVGDLEKLASR